MIPRSIVAGGVMLVLLSAIACDRGNSAFRAGNQDACMSAQHAPLPDSGYKVR